MTTTATPDITELLAKAKFEAWLRDRNPSANVGETRGIETCPIARYLQSSGFPNAWAGKDWIGLYGGQRSVDTPMWARHFIRLVDRLPSGTGDHVKVRAYQARAILARIG